MAMMWVARLMVAALLAWSASGRDVPSHGSSSTDFDYYYLVRQWPATFCNDHSCTHRPPKSFRFTIHGLWPQRDDGTWPEFCDTESHLSMRKLWDLVPFMAIYWPSWSSDNAAFWGHEWTRHGTCSQLGGQHHFFKTVLKLHRKISLEKALDRADIEPSPSAVYPTRDIEDAVVRQYGIKPHVTCDYEGNLAEIWTCISKDLKPVDCTDGPHPHQFAAAAASNNYCRSVKIPPLQRRLEEELATQEDEDVFKWDLQEDDIEADPVGVLADETHDQPADGDASAAIILPAALPRQQQQQAGKSKKIPCHMHMKSAPAPSPGGLQNRDKEGTPEDTVLSAVQQEQQEEMKKHAIVAAAQGLLGGRANAASLFVPQPFWVAVVVVAACAVAVVVSLAMLSSGEGVEGSMAAQGFAADDGEQHQEPLLAAAHVDAVHRVPVAV